MAAESGGLRSYLMVVAPIAVLVIAAAVIWLDRESGLRPLLSLEDEVDQLELRVVALEQERTQLRARARGLRVDAFEVETTARETLGMIRPGERVVRLGDD